MKVLLLSLDFLPPTQTFVYQHATELSKKHKVKIACLKRSNSQLFPFKDIEILPSSESFLKQKIRNRLFKYNIHYSKKNTQLKKALEKLLTNFQPDIIHCHFGTYAILFLDNLELKVPFFVTFQGYDATNKIHSSQIYRKKVKKILDQNLIYPLASSLSLFEFMAKYGINSPRSKVLYAGVDVDFFCPSNGSNSSHSSCHFLQVGGFREKKGHYYTLLAFKKLCSKLPNAKMTFAGGGPLENKIKEMTYQMGIEKHIEFKGWQSPEQVKELMKKTDVFVHPSITTDDFDMESTTVAIMEGMAMELPILSTRHSGIPELVEHGVNGLLAQEKDVDTYAKYMEKLIEWGPQPQNREKIIKHFSKAIHLEKLENYYYQSLK